MADIVMVENMVEGLEACMEVDGKDSRVDILVLVETMD